MNGDVDMFPSPGNVLVSTHGHVSFNDLSACNRLFRHQHRGQKSTKKILLLNTTRRLRHILKVVNRSDPKFRPILLVFIQFLRVLDLVNRRYLSTVMDSKYIRNFSCHSMWTYVLLI
jgi:hypothetical protein